MAGEPVAGVAAWPSLPVAEWQPTRDTLHLWTQVVGKVRLANTPLVNHWWNVPLYVTATGLTTSLIPYGRDRAFEIAFDFVDHRLDITPTDAPGRSMDLVPRSVADFYAGVMSRLDDLGLSTRIWPVPVEIEGAIPFEEDTRHAAYDADQAQRFWRLLVQSDRVLHDFRARFIGKVSPVHVFWGGLDMAVTRFSGRTAPPHRATAPNCGPHVMLEAYSHEVSSAGYWPGGPGGGGEGFYYSYAWPEPEGYRDTPVRPDVARYDADFGEFLLPYEAVRTSGDPEATLLEFLQSTYEAAADRALWDRVALERLG